MKKHIDLNCDMGESFGPWRMGDDEAVMPYITSANVACGGHAGDPYVMAATVDLARRHGVAVGAHPGYPDLQGFGRRPLPLSNEEVRESVLYQIGALWGVARGRGVELTHVKPHGALYNRAAVDYGLASAIVEAVWHFSPSLFFVCLPGSEMEKAGRERGLSILREGFVDRQYEPNGLLADRSLPGALITSSNKALEQAIALALGRVHARDGSALKIEVDTLCLHGDNKAAASIARKVSETLRGAGFIVERAAK